MDEGLLIAEAEALELKLGKFTPAISARREFDFYVRPEPLEYLEGEFDTAAEALTAAQAEINRRAPKG